METYSLYAFLSTLALSFGGIVIVSKSFNTMPAIMRGNKPVTKTNLANSTIFFGAWVVAFFFWYFYVKYFIDIVLPHPYDIDMAIAEMIVGVLFIFGVGVNFACLLILVACYSLLLSKFLAKPLAGVPHSR